MPITRPTLIVWFCRHSGHQRDGWAVLDAREGAAETIAMPLISTSSDHDATAQRQSPLASGSTPTGVVRTVGSVSPMRMPLL
jgi:hypothetical protein